LLGPGGFATPLSLLAGCLALIGTGPGEVSLDEIPVTKKRVSEEHPLAIGLAAPLALASGIGAFLVWRSQKRRREVIEVERGHTVTAPEAVPAIPH
jgi:hypothetical protein